MNESVKDSTNLDLSNLPNLTWRTVILSNNVNFLTIHCNVSARKCYSVERIRTRYLANMDIGYWLRIEERVISLLLLWRRTHHLVCLLRRDWTKAVSFSLLTGPLALCHFPPTTFPPITLTQWNVCPSKTIKLYIHKCSSAHNGAIEKYLIG